MVLAALAGLLAAIAPSRRAARLNILQAVILSDRAHHRRRASTNHLGRLRLRA